MSARATTLDVVSVAAWNAANARARMAYYWGTKDASGAFVRLGGHSTEKPLPVRSHGRQLFLCDDCDCAECRP